MSFSSLGVPVVVIMSSFSDHMTAGARRGRICCKRGRRGSCCYAHLGCAHLSISKVQWANKALVTVWVYTIGFELLTSVIWQARAYCLLHCGEPSNYARITPCTLGSLRFACSSAELAHTFLCIGELHLPDCNRGQSVMTHWHTPCHIASSG